MGASNAPTTEGERMFSLAKIQAIRKILENIPDDILEDCYAEAEKLRNKSYSNFRQPLRNSYSNEHTELACEFMENYDVDYQMAESERIFDALFYRLKVEWAFWMYDQINSTEDVA